MSCHKKRRRASANMALPLPSHATAMPDLLFLLQPESCDVPTARLERRIVVKRRLFWAMISKALIYDTVRCR